MQACVVCGLIFSFKRWISMRKDIEKINFEMSVGNKKFWAEFLELYRSLPVLWRVKSEEYCNRVLKTSAYEKMVTKLKEIDPTADREKVTRKINTFRSNYRRDLKKTKQSEKSGAGAEDIFQSSLWYYDHLHFLADQEDCLEGRTTLENDKRAATPLVSLCIFIYIFYMVRDTKILFKYIVLFHIFCFARTLLLKN